MVAKDSNKVKLMLNQQKFCTLMLNTQQSAHKVWIDTSAWTGYSASNCPLAKHRGRRLLDFLTGFFHNFQRSPIFWIGTPSADSLDVFSYVEAEHVAGAPSPSRTA